LCGESVAVARRWSRLLHKHGDRICIVDLTLVQL
jgi:hypothetical protein